MGGEAKNSPQNIRGPGPAVRTKGDRWVWQAFDQADHIGRGHAHHGATCGVKAHRAAPGHVSKGKAFGGCAEFFGGGNGFEPQHIRTAFFKALGLLVEHFHGGGMAQIAHRFHDIACWPDRACDDNWTTRSIGHVATDFSRLTGQFPRAMTGIMQFQTRGVATKGVGQEDVAASLNSQAVELFDAVGMLVIPEFRRIARCQPHIEQVCACCAVGQKPVTGFQKTGECVAHGSCPS